MFDQILEQVTTQLYSESRYEYIDLHLDNAIKIWCHQLDIPQEITNYILRGYKPFDKIEELTNYLEQEYGSKQQEETNLLEQLGKVPNYFKKNTLNNFVEDFFRRIKIRGNNMKIIGLIAFIITAVGYWLYIINRKKQQPQQPQQFTHRTEVKQHQSVSYVPSPPVKITKQFLVLVIAAEQSDVINFNDGEQLYEVTKNLWLGSESDFYKIKPNLNRYVVAEEEKSEYDIKLVYIELKQSDQGFQPNVDQLERYDAFRKLSDLVVNFEISPRLQMEAYENIEVYSR